MSLSLTSLHSQLASLSSVIAMETNSVTLQQDMLTLSLVNASIALVAAEQVLSTATGEGLAPASAIVSSASSVLYNLFKSNSPYGMIPSQAGNLAMTVIMALLFFTHTFLGVFFQTWWFGITSFIGIGMELIGYISRVISAHNLLSQGPFTTQITLLTIAPAFVMAGVYYLLSQLINIFNPKFALMTPKAYTWTFIGTDIFSLVIQATGGGIAASSTAHQELGTHIMVAGIAIQLIGMTVFIFLFSHYFVTIGYMTGSYEENERNGDFLPEFANIRKGPMFAYFPSAIFVAVVFVYIRSLYRLIELSEGWRGYLITHEAYFMVLDAAMMTLACLTLAVFHPGLMIGRGNPLKKAAGEDIEMGSTNDDSQEDLNTVGGGDKRGFGDSYNYRDIL